tara:strand:- start:5910 stop:6149 length:240 start_codon:yes stop_codon:yes gene_type:complete
MKKQTKGNKMKKVKVQSETSSTSALQVLGFLLIAFAIADFALSWAGVNLTSFMGSASRFSPMIFGFIGATLMSAGKDGD